VEKDDNRRLRPTDTGNVVTDLLKESFPDIMDLKFTAQMEERLDEVESGDQDWREVLSKFWDGFSQRLETANKSMREVKREATETDILCDVCGQSNMVIKWGRNGRFLACPRYPECKNTRELSGAGGLPAPAPEPTSESCDLCGRPMVIKSGRTGRFLACTGYPECRGIKPFKIGVKCPKCLVGDICERISKKGRMFFSCSTYPKCDFVEWSRPVPRACPACGNSYMVNKDTKYRRALMCPRCKHVETLEELAEVGTGK
jgi:DNA topoisomerase-1